VSQDFGIPVVRVDRPMAERAAEIGGRILVVVAVPSTLGPTRELLAECIAKSPLRSTLIESPCLDAWELFEAGDAEGYANRIATHIRTTADQVDVVVLAQASMAAAAGQLGDLPIPVLSSPTTAVRYAAGLADN
jgi:Asp/Glu/hydantoin racemase